MVLGGVKRVITFAEERSGRGTCGFLVSFLDLCDDDYVDALTF